MIYNCDRSSLVQSVRCVVRLQVCTYRFCRWIIHGMFDIRLCCGLLTKTLGAAISIKIPELRIPTEAAALLV